ncbi:polyunsaturated fatty acid 5-lipoxygenase-like [Mercenaria mercenaria]|uniref:polyunsaturated fatty acid 5-lipoxygenase-like n=1 Tax=Mercenaria mercenaria TaxID=6596 RepID=UPI00234E393A|nr:polyunsaturated fatty acid 5-lipoxygenase-like [Mercenaria mercenaria]XP_053382176.1 polyunsaturated fatty acid 5-lipoxygenase-like [Mercenaria mercenaria]XP_053382177.1 polyunsaturated fatty acid 5-lipoxygenase-like [Mercenaria mercenaria]XP_053382178.1 polyunsaturated fatty acid 5-lipoxygenase-like [Mercenaria mercenaria]
MDYINFLYTLAFGIFLLLINGAIKSLLESSFTYQYYTIAVESADKPRALCIGVIHIKLVGDDGDIGKEVELVASVFPEKFKRGYKNIFKIENKSYMSITGIYVRGGKSVGETGWNIDRFTVTNEDTGEETIIPVFTNIRAGRTYKFLADDDTLPQSASIAQKEDRKRDLQYMRELYELTEERLPGCPPLVKQLPPEETFSYSYQFELGTKAAAFLIDAKFKELFSGGFHEIEDMHKVFHRLLKVFPVPSNLNRWRDDVLFGMQRLMGVNPNVIRLCTKIPEKLAVDDHMLKPFLENMSLPQALQEKRIFVIDYEILQKAHPKAGYIMTAPIALFYQRYDGNLVPVAIQLFQKPGDDNPVFLPSDRVNTWILAKMWFNLADANYHQSISHVGFTHLKMEGIVVCTHRQIHRSHPVYKLLMPHFLYLLAINHMSIPQLLERNGFIDKVLNIGSDGMKDLIKHKNMNWRMDIDGDLLSDLKTRGVYDPDNPNLLPYYYYRDDALKLYECIYSYVKKYLDLYYRSDGDVKEDYELQNWRKEFVTPVEEQGLGLLGVYGVDGKFTTKDHVYRILTNIIFICSVQHAAVNFRQYEEYAFPPNYPASLRGHPPYSKEQIDEAMLMKSLPDEKTMYNTMIIASITSTQGMNKLGNFEVEYITDKEALKVAAEFRSNLKLISEANDKSNTKRRHEKYTCLNPNFVPNSISI